jgi:CDGSH-type Zn-finger protein
MDEITVKTRANGPLEVRGDIKLVDANMNIIPLQHEGVNFLCRCGHSKTKPFCDGTHKEMGWTDENPEG